MYIDTNNYYLMEEEESLTFWFAGTWFPSGSTRWPEAGQFRWLLTGAEIIVKIKP